MLSPTDAAWSVLEEGHRVEKLLPLAALPLLAAAGYGVIKVQRMFVKIKSLTPSWV